ncbi:hypothetical protein HDN1F_37450 [gamma proteobacterium HdN1]|nr:hypothetical protein HDN1F_37450 [gamma proteobacterium HdN1]
MVLYPNVGGFGSDHPKSLQTHRSPIPLRGGVPPKGVGWSSRITPTFRCIQSSQTISFEYLII